MYKCTLGALLNVIQALHLVFVKKFFSAMHCKLTKWAESKDVTIGKIVRELLKLLFDHIFST